MVYASLEKGIAEFRSAETGPKSHLLADFFGLLLITFTSSMLSVPEGQS